MFKIIESNKNIKVFPKVGLIKENSFQMILIRILTTEYGLFEDDLLIKFNNLNEINKIKIIGFCSYPNIELENENKLFFPPSYLGVYNKSEYYVYNKSLVESKIFIDIPEKQFFFITNYHLIFI